MKYIFFTLLMLLCVNTSFAQFATYKPLKKEYIDPFKGTENKYNEVEIEHRRAMEAARVVQSNTIKSEALCIDTENVHDIQVKLQRYADGTIDIKVFGIKEPKGWVSCSVKVKKLSQLLESYPTSDMENRSYVLSLMEIATLYFVYNNKFYVTGSPD